MLNFFEQQAKAKRRTAVLVVLYLLGVFIFVIALTPIVLAVLFLIANGLFRKTGLIDENQFREVIELARTSPMEVFTRPEAQLFWVIAFAASVLLVFGASMWKASVLRSGGGQAVAESLGGQLVVHSATLGLHHKRLLNVVEEMAIASGIPVPQVYILDDEHSINAFAAGYTSSDAVVAVTRGAVTSLSREQLQGVIAHEFSHILSGDMRLNIRLIGLLFGIVAIQVVGSTLLRAGFSGGSRRSRGSGKAALVIIIVGAACFLLGIVGATIAQLIKALIARQCEYRADAAAVQFTRNPEGLAQALQVVGGTSNRGIIDHSGTQECSHLFFVSALTGPLLNSHPPLKARIRRPHPSWTGAWRPPPPHPARCTGSR